MIRSLIRRTSRFLLVTGVLLCPSLGSSPGLNAAGQLVSFSLRETYARIDACWVRPDFPEADTLEMPKQICISKVGVIVPMTGGLPLSDSSALIVEGDPVSGRLNLSGAEQRGGGWSVMGLYPRTQQNKGCGELNEASISISVDIDQLGQIRKTSPRVHGFLMDGSPQCPRQAGVVKIRYNLVP